MYQNDPGANVSLTVHAPAKLNLFFEVYGKRSDGFHEIASIALPIRLYDTLVLEPSSGRDIELECHGGGSDIPVGDENIVVRALRLFRERTKIDQGVRVRLFKRIPSRAGLGGGSSDAAAALSAAKKIWKPDLSDRQLVDLAAEIGSDCPIFFHRGASLSRGRGETIRPVPSVAPLHFVVYKPVEGLSTAEVYNECMPTHDRRFREPEALLEELKNGNPARIARCFFNRLEASAERIWPGFEKVKREMERLDCLAVRMSGSGTAFYGFCRSARHAKQVAARLRTGPGEQVFSVAGM